MAEQLVGAAVKIQLADSAIIGEEGKKKVPIVQVATFAAAAAAVITYILAMFWERSRVVYTAGGFSFVVSSVVIFQRTRLMKLETLRQVINKIRMDVNRLQGENDQLTAHNDELARQVEGIKDVEQSLNNVLSVQGGNSATFIEKVKENQLILDQIKKNLEAKITQDILSVVMRSDRDEDFRIDPEEVDVLVLRLKSAQGVKLDEQRFRSEIGQSGYRVSTVLNICKGMLSDDSDESPIHISTKGLKAKHV